MISRPEEVLGASGEKHEVTLPQTSKFGKVSKALEVGEAMEVVKVMGEEFWPMGEQFSGFGGPAKIRKR